MITKEFGKDFSSSCGALTLGVHEVSDDDPKSGIHTKIHDDGWVIKGEVHGDYDTWVNHFNAVHPYYSIVEGDFENEIHATSQEGFDHFWKHHEPEAWDYWDI